MRVIAALASNVLAGSLITPAVTGTTAAQAATGPEVGVASSVQNVRPTGVNVPQLPDSVKLTAARNESESFQVVVQGPVSDVRMSGDLFGWGTTSLSRVDYYTVTTPSDTEGATGRWGDPLVPDRDVVYGQQRNAFPVTVPAGENRAVWVDVHVPQTAEPGTYQGSVSITSAAGTASVPVTLEVLGFTLPSTSSLKNAFMMHYSSGSYRDVCRAHYGTNDCGDAAALSTLYSRMALDNRVTIPNGSGLRHNGSPAELGSWEAGYEQPVVHGTTTVPAGARWRLQGASATTVGQYGYTPDHCGAACMDRWEAEANEAGQQFANHFFVYGCDEASTVVQWANCGTSVRSAVGAWKRPILVTGTMAKYRSGAEPAGFPQASIIAPLIKDIDGHRSEYDAFLAGGADRELWLYSSCSSSGCAAGAPNDPFYFGWPDYAIDAPANQHRAMNWMIWRYRASGELYWSMQQNLAQAWAPGGLFHDGSNGDGSLFYPGTPARIGGTTHVPLESVRLKRIRDGREDYEYLTWLRNRGYGAQVDEIVASVYPHAKTATAAKDGTGAGTLLAARDRLTSLVRTALGSTPPAPDRPVAFASNEAGSFDIFTMSNDGGNRRRLTTTADDDRRPAWSPDGIKIAFNRGTDIWVMNADGSNPVNVTAGVAAPADKPAWSKDGRSLVHVRRIGGHDEVWTMPGAGGAGTALVTFAQTGKDAYDPAVAGSGWVYYSLAGDLHRLDAATGTTRPVMTGAPTQEVPDLGNRSERLAASVAPNPNGRYAVLTRQGTTDTAVSPAELEHALHASWGPNDTTLVFSARTASSDWELWTVRPDGTAAAQVSDNARDDVDPDWRPDAPPDYSGLPGPGPDTTAPVLAEFTVPATTTGSTVSITVDASDDVAVTQMRFAGEDGNWRAWQGFQPRSTVTLKPGTGFRGLYVQVRDAAGNESRILYRKTLVAG